MKHVLIRGIVLVLGICAPPPFLAAATDQPRIDGIEATTEREIRISGQHFGSRCASCRVVIDYGDLRYQAGIRHWENRLLVVYVPDLNRSQQVSLRLQTAKGDSRWIQTSLQRKILPARDLMAYAPGPMSGLLTFDLSSARNVGGKGEQKYPVRRKSPQCGQKSLLFDHARIVFGQRRFGDAQIVSTPSPGCVDCEPIVVRWYHEPTGRLSFQLQVYHREVEGICKNMIIADG